jgi:transglutaminase-like putative cysteine protease
VLNRGEKGLWDVGDVSIGANPIRAGASARATLWRTGALLCVLAGGSALAADPVTAPRPLVEVIAFVDAGKFAQAESEIARAEAAEVCGAAAQRAACGAYRFERERMRRIRLDFTLTRAEVEAQLRAEIPDCTDADFARWDVPKKLESLDIDGERRWFARAVPNLFRVDADASARRRADAKRGVDGPMETLNAHHREIVAAGRDAGVSRRVRVTQKLIVDADAVPAGERVRAWIPYPRAIDGQQERIVFLGSTPSAHSIAPESTLQRTVYLEQPAQSGVPTEFSISYELTVRGRHLPTVPGNAVPAAASSTLAPFLAERPPHLVFTPALRAYSKRVVGDATDPREIAQKLFAAVDTIPWGSAREYSTISNISDYALHQGHADCGQQTLLLMALLRLNGIPSRWQSGMVFSDDGRYDNLHDWGQLYLEPHGWIPMDVTTGQLESEDPALRWFYLGSLDAYRIAFNDDYSTALVPPKRHPRSETVDSQRGEAEWDGGNLYFDQWDYRFEAHVVPEAPGS